MRDLVQQPVAPAAPAAPAAQAAQAATADAEAARLDAQLELAAKKAALRSLEAQGQGGAATLPAAPPPPGMSRTTIVLEKDGKTTVLENPTAEQLREVGIGRTEAPTWRPEWQHVALVGSVVFGVVAVLYLLLAPRRRFLWTGADAGPSGAMDERMTRLENAVETVAMELERMGENQRYATRMLAEGAAMPVVAAAQPERVLRTTGEG